MSNGKSENYFKPAGKPYKGRNKCKRKARLRSRSKKKREQDKIYSKLRKEFLAARPVDKLWCIRNGWKWYRDGIYLRGDGAWMATAVDLTHALGAPLATTIHHGRRRGKYTLDTSTWHELALESHEWVESHPKEAEELGLLDPQRNRRPLELP